MFIDFPPVKDVIIQGMEDIRLPKMVRIRQIYDASHIEDVSQHVQNELESHIHNKTWFDGKRICITVGSRGIPHIDTITRTICDCLKRWGVYHPRDGQSWRRYR